VPPGLFYAVYPIRPSKLLNFVVSRSIGHASQH
jgi:hypothetical protein